MAGPDPVCQVAAGVWRIANQIHPSNSYICATGEPGACFLVDPGTDTGVIDAALAGLRLEPRQIFCTHGHFDHAGGAAWFQEKYGAPCYLHGADLKTLRSSNFLIMAFRIPFSMTLPTVVEAEGFTADLGGRTFRVIPAPGHTPGSCLFQFGELLFTGDTLYARGVGLSKLPGGNGGMLRATLLDLWDRIPGQALVLPGHGEHAPFSQIRLENRPLLEFLGLAGGPVQER